MLSEKAIMIYVYICVIYVDTIIAIFPKIIFSGKYSVCAYTIIYIVCTHVAGMHINFLICRH